MAIALCVLETTGRLVRLECMSVMPGSLGNGERRSQGTGHGISHSLCSGTWILSKASGSSGKVLWQVLPVLLSDSLAVTVPMQAKNYESQSTRSL